MDPPLPKASQGQNDDSSTSSTPAPETNSNPILSSSGKNGPQIGMEDEPLQLIDFHESADKTSITIRDATIDHVFGQIGDEPVNIILVCGPSSQGKSFLLSYMVRWLEGLEKKEDDWVGWEEKTKPLKGFKFRNETAPETQWIWVWSRPFIVKNDEGKEVAILLVDTQGSSEEFAKNKDMPAIVGLSLHTSSVTIFNLVSNLQEDALLDLYTYIGSIALAMGYDSDPPFQKLNFLIRDWNNPAEIADGGKGGKQFLGVNLWTNEGQPQQDKQIRESIRKCFQELDCFLMPSIGEKALGEDFQSSISEVSPNFAKKMEEFLNDLISTENMTTKEIMGSQVSAQELRTFLEKWVEIFNSDDIPSAESMWESTSQIYNNVVLEKTMKKYRDLMKKKKSSTYISAADLYEAHTKAEKQALEFFKKAKKCGAADIISGIKETLQEKIEAEFSEMERQNKDKRDKIINEATTEAVEIYKSQLENTFPFDDDNQFYDESNMKTTSDMNKATCAEEFELKLSKENEEKLKDPHKNKMDKLQTQFIKDNLSELVQKTTCTPELLAILQREQLLHDEDIKHLNVIKHQRAKAAVLYELVQKKGSSFEALHNAMQEAGQTGTCSILDRCQVSNIFRYRSICYQRRLLIGRGRYGSNVYRGEYRLREVAVKKVYHEHNPNKPLVEGHVESLIKSQSHPHDRVVRYFQAEYADEFILIAMELSTTNLDRWIRETPKEFPSKLDLLGQITDGVEHLHSNGIIHGNLHPANILISVTGENAICVRISDFGMLNTIKYVTNKRKIFLSGFGTGGWMAPEVIRYIGGDKEEPNNAADIFSLGCIFYYVLTGGKHPFGDNIHQMGNILDGNVVLCESEFTVIDFGALSFVWLIRQMVSQRQAERPPAGIIPSHPIFWPNERVAQFLHDVLPFVDKHSALLDNCASIVTHNAPKYQDHTLSSLLKSIHEMSELHPRGEMTTEIPPDYYRTWLSQFPYLLPVTWTVFQAESDPQIIKKYYDHTRFFKYNLVRKSGNLLEIFPLPQLGSEENRCSFLGFAKAVFKSKLKEKIPLETHESEQQFYNEVFIQERFQEVKSEILDDIHELLSNEGEKVRTELEQSFQRIWKSTLDSYLGKNKEHRKKAEAFMNSVVKQLLSNFKRKLEKCILQFPPEQSEDHITKLDQSYQKCRSTQLQSFEMAKKSYPSELHKKYLDNLEESMTNIFAELTNRNADRVLPAFFLEEDINQYEIKLSKIAQDGCGINETALRLIHSMKVELVLGRLEHSHPLQAGINNGVKIKVKLQERLQKIFDNILTVIVRGSTSSESASMEEEHGYDCEDELDKSLLNPDPNFASDRPLQIINFFPENGPGTKQLQVNQENLNFVLDQAKDLPVCVISICGPARQGKSFMLNYLARHLEGMEIGKEVVQNANGKSRPLLGFDFGSDASKATKGFWMWSRPFIIKNNEGDEIAVLLMDTQGLDSELTSTRDSSIIAGMSMLASSAVIFNVFHTLTEHDLVALNNYTHYGMQALEKANEHGFPFQKLMFLIRDWNAPSEFPYGGVGGRSFLEEKLKARDVHPTKAKFIRTTIQNNFEKLDCFLLPHIGEKALRSNFNGSVAKLNPRFASKLQECIAGIINPEVIPIKKILGCQITAPELKISLHRYVEIFNSDTFPNPPGTWLPLSQPQHKAKNPIAGAIQKYLAFSDAQKPEGDTYVMNETICNLHREATHASLDFLRQETLEKKFELEDKLSLGFKLTGKLESQFAQIIRKYMKSNQKLISTTVDAVGEKIRKKLATEVPLEVDGGPKFYEDAVIQNAGEKAQDELLDKFLSFPDEAKQELDKLMKERLPTILKAYLDHNSTHKKAAISVMTSIANETFSSFYNQIEQHFQNTKFADADAKFIAEFQPFKLSHVRSFEEITELPKTYLFDQKLAELDKKMDKAIDDLREKQKLLIQRFDRDTEKLFTSDLAQYATELRDVARAGDSNEDALKIIHSMKVSSILCQFLVENPFPKEHPKSIKLETRLTNELQQILDNVLAAIPVCPKPVEESSPAVISQSVELYDNEMRSALNSIVFMTDEDLEQEHQRVQDKVIQKLRPFSVTDSGENGGEVELEIMTGIKTRLETFKQLNLQNRRAAEKAGDEYVIQCKLEYTKLMQNEVTNFKTEEELTSFREHIKPAVLNQLRDSCSNWDTTFTDQFMETLETYTDKVYEELKNGLRVKLSELQLTLAKLLLDAKDQYHEEMDGHFQHNPVFTPETLLDIHDEVKRIVIKNVSCDHAVALSKSQEQELSLRLDDFLAKYQERNYMNANFDQTTPAIGIDLGTTYCCVAAYYRGSVHVIPNSAQNISLTTPSYVAYDPTDGYITYGWPAKDNAYKNPEYTIYDTKRIIGRKFADPELYQDMKLWPFAVQDCGDGNAKVRISQEELVPPQEISAKLLTELRKLAEIYLELEPGTITKAVITVPATFNEEQRKATRAAGELAGLHVLDILNEPTAAVISYSIDKLDKSPRKVLVYDLGGGTFDLAILEVTSIDIKILGLNGDSHLGGEDFDRKIMEYCSAIFKEETGIDLLAGKDSRIKNERDDTRRRLRRLQKYCETAKQDLTTARQARVIVDGITAGMDLSVIITKEKFEELNMTYFQKTIQIIDETLKEICLPKEDVTDVVLVGGSSRIPKVEELLEEYFRGKALNRWIHPDHIVAHGAAIVAALLNGKKEGNGDPVPVASSSSDAQLIGN